MGKTIFVNDTVVTPGFLNAVNKHRHTGLDVDGDGILDYATSSGSNNAYVLTLPTAITAHVAGMPIKFKSNFTNTGAATINISSLGAKTIKKLGGLDLEANDIISGQIYTISYDGTYYQFENASTTEKYAVASGSANAYVMTLSPALMAHVAGREISFKANFTNTGAATININGLGAVALKKLGSLALEANDIISGQIVTIAYDGSYYQVKSISATERYATSTGSANAYVLTLAPALAAHIAGKDIKFKSNFTNTGASTLTVNSLSAVAIKRQDGTALQAGDISSGAIITVVYDGTYYQLGTPLSTIPVGAEMFWPKETPPAGWLEENGAAISRTTYAALFALIGTMYGSGDGSTTFNLPDSRGMFPRVWDHGAAIDPDRASRTDRGDGTSGDHVGTKQAEEFKSHSHSINRTGDQGAGADDAVGQGLYGYMGGNLAGNTGALTIANTGGNETRPINTNRMMIIKY